MSDLSASIYTLRNAASVSGGAGFAFLECAC